MSMVQQVINDARKLATKLTEHDNTVDNLLSQTQGVFKKIECMKEYCEQMNELNEATNNHPRNALIHSIQQENRHIRDLQRENKELRLALEEHQNIMELIMSKYRQQILKLVSVNNSKNMLSDTADEIELSSQMDRVQEMVAVMRKAAQISEDEFCEQQRIISTLATENKGLREMLHIALKSGSLGTPSVSSTHTQTDETLESEQFGANANPCIVNGPTES